MLTRSSGSKNTAPALRSLAEYMAMSALASSASGVVPCSGDIATPMLASTSSVASAAEKLRCSASRRRSATTSACSRSGTDGNSTANSSPPRRASVSPWRTTSPSRSATWRSSSSPYEWPSVSLISLKRSRSMNRTATSASLRSADRERAFEPFLEQDAVRQAGQRVMRGLAAQPARRQQHDAIERRPQQQQAAGDHAVHRARVSRDLRLDRRVREVDLIHADRARRRRWKRSGT